MSPRQGAVNQPARVRRMQENAYNDGVAAGEEARDFKHPWSGIHGPALRYRAKLIREWERGYDQGAANRIRAARARGGPANG